MIRSNLKPIVRIVVLYMILCLFWIVVTDWLVAYGQRVYGISPWVETAKEFLFILISGLVLFLLLSNELELREESFRRHLAEEKQLQDRLRQKGAEILEAYDLTIEGWSRVLEMRSREVKDHSRRVTRLTLCLARYLGVPDEDLAHIRRGALLHDIGKMAVPDSIMLKEGELTSEERSIIRKHPLYGFQMLTEIEFLRPALDIMLCHHEKWNGDGYPFGLKGTDIPYFARIFSVVDVWDALIADDRPYRKAQTAEEVLDYIRSEAGQHFDPEIVDAFVRMLTENPELADPNYLLSLKAERSLDFLPLNHVPERV